LNRGSSFWGLAFKDIKKASAVLARAERLSAELIFLMSLNAKPQKEDRAWIVDLKERSLITQNKFCPEQSKLFRDLYLIYPGPDVVLLIGNAHVANIKSILESAAK
tara:strand:+ start:44506 stop:44823 length:318 start_codon:yes stop_codon:yes gene_type:complete